MVISRASGILFPFWSFLWRHCILSCSELTARMLKRRRTDRVRRRWLCKAMVSLHSSQCLPTKDLSHQMPRQDCHFGWLLPWYRPNGIRTQYLSWSWAKDDELPWQKSRNKEKSGAPVAHCLLLGTGQGKGPFPWGSFINGNPGRSATAQQDKTCLAQKTLLHAKMNDDRIKPWVLQNSQ